MQEDAKEGGKKKAAAGGSAAASSSQPSAAKTGGDADMADAEPSTSELEEAVRKHAGQPTGGPAFVEAQSVCRTRANSVDMMRIVQAWRWFRYSDVRATLGAAVTVACHFRS